MLHAAMPWTRKLLTLTIATALQVGCSGNKQNTASPRDSAEHTEPESHQKAANPPDATSTDPVELVEQCYSAIEEAAVADSKPSAGAKAAATTSCASLFRHKRCKAAWHGIRNSSGSDKMVHVFSECAAAYCPSLEDRGLAACSGLADSSAQRYANFAELTLSVLELEWGKDTGREMSARLVQLTTPVVSFDGDRVLLDGVEIARVEDFPSEPEWRIAPLYEALRKRAGPGAAGLPIKIRAGKSIAARTLNLLIENSVAAGYEQVSFCTVEGSDAEDAREARPVKEQCSSPATFIRSEPSPASAIVPGP
jgi:hypothetical protein